jgi:hypothetical protein
MPDMTSAAKFLRSVRNRRTHTTEALEDVFADPEEIGSHPHYDDVKDDPNHFDTLDNDCRGILAALSDPEVAHINDWDNEQKEAVRLALVEAVDNERRVRFYWELYNGSTERTTIESPTSGTVLQLPGSAADVPERDGDDIITFSSPEAFVRAVANDNIVVGVGGPPE